MFKCLALFPISRDWICGCSREICPRVKFCMWFLCRLSKLGFHLSANRLLLKYFKFFFFFSNPLTTGFPWQRGGREKQAKGLCLVLEAVTHDGGRALASVTFP